MATSKRDTLITGLRNAYGMEGQALSTMENVQSRLENYPQLKAAVTQHIAETRQQQQMVEQMLHRFGEEPSTIKEAAMKMVGNLQSMFHATTSDEVLKNSFALHAFEGFEIAAYTSLTAMAEQLGETEVANTCRQILRQEEATEQKLRQLIPQISQTYMDLEASGATSSR